VRALSAAGKQVWLLDPMPTYDYPVPAALAQYRRRGRDPAAFGMTVAEYRHAAAPARAMLSRVAQATGAQRIAVDSALCREARCDVVDAEGHGLYMDSNHLNMAGARLLAERALHPALQPSR
jgi:hypothetical protein